MLPWGSRWGGCRWGWSWWVELASDLVLGRLRPIVDGCLSWQEVPWRYSSRYSRSPLILSLPSPWFPSVFHHVHQWRRHQDEAMQRDLHEENHRYRCRYLGHQTCGCSLGWLPRKGRKGTCPLCAPRHEFTLWQARCFSSTCHSPNMSRKYDFLKVATPLKYKGIEYGSKPEFVTSNWLGYKSAIMFDVWLRFSSKPYVMNTESWGELFDGKSKSSP